MSSLIEPSNPRPDKSRTVPRQALLSMPLSRPRRFNTASASRRSPPLCDFIPIFLSEILQQTPLLSCSSEDGK